MKTKVDVGEDTLLTLVFAEQLGFAQSNHDGCPNEGVAELHFCDMSRCVGMDVV